ncbi:protein of unknown function [Georgfuchsia toluolica]|uniref:Uncharacterized protein n=1 Tax=Georgfuchsia toluolica TaxID=424218 RepID=A0A916N392_9PROT|nr:protein of unknown function [Georgfuchsia toluolica]
MVSLSNHGQTLGVCLSPFDRLRANGMKYLSLTYTNLNNSWPTLTEFSTAVILESAAKARCVSGNSDKER